MHICTRTIACQYILLRGEWTQRIHRNSTCFVLFECHPTTSFICAAAGRKADPVDREIGHRLRVLLLEPHDLGFADVVCIVRTRAKVYSKCMDTA